MKITADFNKITGRVKPMHGIGQPPFLGTYFGYFKYLTNAGIPYSRLHDVGGTFALNYYVDIPNIFRDFDADETLEESYDFAFTDLLITELKKANVEPFFRLGVTIENAYDIKAYRIYPPKDFHKWARICEHIIRHYNEGWADGFHYDIKYWEIWNEPEGCVEPHYPKLGTWLGTPEEFYSLYEITANHLKKCFGDSINVGGYASVGFGASDDYPDMTIPGEHKTLEEFCLKFIHGFFKHISSAEHKAPLDFFSWHSYENVHCIKRFSAYCRKIMEMYGFGDVEDFLNEWNPSACRVNDKKNPVTSAHVMAVMIAMQNGTTSMLNYYDARIGTSSYAGMFDAETKKPTKVYYTFLSFNQAYKLGNAVETSSDDENVFVCGATGDKKSVLLISNMNDCDVEAELVLEGASVRDVDIHVIDEIYDYADTGMKINDGKITLSAHSCVEIRFYK